MSNRRKKQFAKNANSDKLVNFYNLDVVISVGYRVKSKNGIIFRKWVNKILKDYLIKSYAINEKSEIFAIGSSEVSYVTGTILPVDVGYTYV